MAETAALLSDGATGAVTLIQRFGWAINLIIHFHILFLGGVYVNRDNQPSRFKHLKAPDKSELEELVQLISQRVGRCLKRQWLGQYIARPALAFPRLSLSSTGKVIYD